MALVGLFGLCNAMILNVFCRWYIEGLSILNRFVCRKYKLVSYVANIFLDLMPISIKHATSH